MWICQIAIRINILFFPFQDEKVVKGGKYKADGEYYPKILFLDSNAELLEDEWNHGTVHSHVKHYYGDGAER